LFFTFHGFRSFHEFYVIRVNTVVSKPDYVHHWSRAATEMPFVRPRCNRHIDVPPPVVKGINRVQHITALGVTLSHSFSMSKHINAIMAGCARTLYGLRTLRAHGMPQACLQIVFRSTALAKLLYASPAWWRFANASKKNRLEAFLR